MGLKCALRSFVLAALVGAGCGSGKTAAEPTTGGTPSASFDAAVMATAPAGDYTCTSDADCVISCEIADDCCGEACQCELPYHRDQERAIRDHNAQEYCVNVEPDCPQYDCDRPSEDIVPVCVDGTCAAKRVPR